MSSRFGVMLTLPTAKVVTRTAGPKQRMRSKGACAFLGIQTVNVGTLTLIDFVSTAIPLYLKTRTAPSTLTPQLAF